MKFDNKNSIKFFKVGFSLNQSFLIDRLFLVFTTLDLLSKYFSIKKIKMIPITSFYCKITRGPHRQLSSRGNDARLSAKTTESERSVFANTN
jgi:hypothetical protein